MTRGLFVTGTDTGVGKTFLASALASALCGRGCRVGVMKPAESGCARAGGRLVPQDAELLMRASGCTSPMKDVNPYALATPLAPALAAEREGVEIDLAHILDCFDRVAASHDLVIVEGAGGLLTPLVGSQTIRDLAALLGLPLLIVARNVLGAINHTALTAAAARDAGPEIAGLVLNDVGSYADDAMITNAAALRRWGGAPLIAHVPYIPAGDVDAAATAGQELADRLAVWLGVTSVSLLPPPPEGSGRKASLQK